MASDAGPCGSSDGGKARSRALDAVLLLAVPLSLLSIHVLLPDSLRTGLAFSHGRPDPVTLLTGAYVHGGFDHLRANLVGYAVGALNAYGLAAQAGRRRWFRRTFVALLLVLPVPVHAVSLLAFSLRYPGIDPVSRGFSGVVGGFAGFVFVALYQYVRSRRGPRVAHGVAAGVASLLLLELDVVYAGRLRPGFALLALAALAVAGVLVVGPPTLRRAVAGERPALTPDRDRVLADAVVVGLAAVVLAVLVYNLFPPPVAQVAGDGYVDVFSHAAGVLLGGGMAVALAVREA